jgi:hypothetical protein
MFAKHIYKCNDCNYTMKTKLMQNHYRIPKNLYLSKTFHSCYGIVLHFIQRRKKRCHAINTFSTSHCDYNNLLSTHDTHTQTQTQQPNKHTILLSFSLIAFSSRLRSFLSTLGVWCCNPNSIVLHLISYCTNTER